MGLRKLNEDQAAHFASLYRLNNCNAAETYREYRPDSDKLAEETHRWNGCQISNQPMVSQAITRELKTAREIQEKVAAKHDIKFETIVDEFREGYERAMEKGALTAAMIALKEICKLFMVSRIRMKSERSSFSSSFPTRDLASSPAITT